MRCASILVPWSAMLQTFHTLPHQIIQVAYMCNVRCKHTPAALRGWVINKIMKKLLLYSNWTSMYLCTYVYVCTYVCQSACLYDTCMLFHVCMYESMFACLFTRAFSCMYVRMFVCLCMVICVSMCECMCGFIYLCMHASLRVYVCIYKNV